MKSVIASLIVLSGLAVSVPSLTAQAAEPVTLKFAFPAPPVDPNYASGVAPWIEEVNKAAGGALQIQAFPGMTLANFGNVYDRVLNNVAQLAFGTFGPVTSQFPRTQVSTVSFDAQDTVRLSKALWALYAAGTFNPEFDQVKLLALFSFAGPALNTNEPITSLATLKGMKVAVSGRTMGDVMNALGATPVTLTPTEFFQGLQRGTVRAAAISMGAAEEFKLDEVTTHHLLAPLGNSPGWVFMNKAAYAALPENLQKLLDRHSGASLSEKMGVANDVFQRNAIAHIKARPGQHVSEISAAQFAGWKTRIEPIVQSWVKDTPNGAAVLAALHAELARLQPAN
jgi:TRAP-type C4-dicarboxylate transport system substrate-binding protein